MFFGKIITHRSLASSLGSYLALLAAVVVLMLMLHHKVKHVYWVLMHSELVHFDPSNTQAAGKVMAMDSSAQTRLFWFGKPDLLISILQFTLFFLALGLGFMVYKELQYPNPDQAVQYIEVSVYLFAVVVYFLGLPELILR